MKKYISFIVLCFCSILTKAQNTIEPPKIAPPTAEAAAFARYGEIPVDYSTGVPNISIPIYNVKSGDLEFPLSFSYHASGNKVSDIATACGLGWVFNGSGIITQTTLGGLNDNDGSIPEFKASSEITQAITNIENQYPLPVNGATTSGYVIPLGPSYNERFLAFKNLAHTLDMIVNNRDTQSDRYTYNFNGHAGVFRKDFMTGEMQLIPYEPIKIIKGDNKFTIIDEKGTSYLFDMIEQSDIEYTLFKTYSYYLTSITSLDGANSIFFEYIDAPAYHQDIPNQSLSYGIVPTYSSIGGCGYILQAPIETSIFQNYSVSRNTPKLLSKIISRDCIVSVEYSDEIRPDYGGKRLKEINIFARYGNETVPVNNNDYIKKITLNHSYFGNVADKNQRLKLDEVIFSDKKNEVQKYVFDYNTTALPAYFERNELLTYNRIKTSTDYWGYFNGFINSYMFPSDALVSAPSSVRAYGGNRSTNEMYTKASILTAIKYPTGGRTEFDYEANNAVGFGGLRIKSIKNYANEISTTPSTSKIFLYGDVAVRSDAYGITQLYAFESDRVYFLSGCCGGISKWTSINTSSLYSISDVIGHATYYNSITEILGPSETSNIGKIEYTYQYPDVASVYNESVTDDNPLRLYDFDWGIFAGLLKEKKEYTFGSPNPIRVTTNTYEKVKSRVFSTGYKLLQGIQYMSAICNDENIIDVWPEPYSRGYIYKDSKAFSERYNLTNTTIIDYLGSQTLRKETNYAYNDELQISQQTETFNNKTVRTEYKYSLELDAAMYNDHLYSPLLETTQYVNDKQVNKTRTYYNNYTDLAPKMYLPQSIKTQRNSTDITETRLRYHQYDNKGNVVRVSKEKDVRVNYIWGYNQNYPVAKIENADSVLLSGYITAIQTASNADNDRTVDIVDSNGIKTYIGKEGSLRQVLDNLRNTPAFASAVITTYTYDPLIGVTSQTDANGKTIYYCYDDFGRLISVSDDQGNLVSNYEYNYKKP